MDLNKIKGIAVIVLSIIVGLAAGTGIGCIIFSGEDTGDSYTAYRVCGGWNGGCRIFPKNEWRLERTCVFSSKFYLYHKTDPTKWYRGFSWSDHLTTVKLDANGKIVQ